MFALLCPHILWLYASYLLLWSYFDSFTSLLSTAPKYDLLFLLLIAVRKRLKLYQRLVISVLGGTALKCYNRLLLFYKSFLM